MNYGDRRNVRLMSTKTLVPGTCPSQWHQAQYFLLFLALPDSMPDAGEKVLNIVINE